MTGRTGSMPTTTVENNDVGSVVKESSSSSFDKNGTSVPFSCPAPTEDHHAGIFQQTHGNHKNGNDNNSSTVAFLLLTHGEKEVEVLAPMWERWFESPHYQHHQSDGSSTSRQGQQQRHRNWTLWVHTKPTKSGVVDLPPFFCPYAIPSQPSRYMHLLQAMYQLLEYAYAHDTRAQHFVFLSASTIPLVSFQRVHRALTDPDNNNNNKSRFCFFETRQAERCWNHTYSHLHLSKSQLRKAELWSGLTRSHVELLLQPNTKSQLLEWDSFFKEERHRASQQQQQHPSSKDEIHIGAPDELFFATWLLSHRPTSEFHECHGAIPSDGTTSSSSISVTTARHGCCPTYVSWEVLPHEFELPSGAAGAGNDLAPRCVKDRLPCTYRKLKLAGLQRLAQREGYWFLRKVQSNAVVLWRTDQNATTTEELEIAQAMPKIWNMMDEWMGEDNYSNIVL